MLMRHALGASAAVMLLASCLRSAGAADPEQVCIKAPQQSYTGESIACYSDAGCKQAEAMGGDPVRGYDEASAPFALARGKIAAVITSSGKLMAKIRSVGGSCRPARP